MTVTIDRLASAFSSEMDQYARKYKGEKTPQLDFGDDKPHWITIGAVDHTGGHPVQIDKEGKMVTGHFAGMTLGEAFGPVGKKQEVGHKKPDYDKRLESLKERRDPDGIESNEKLPLFEQTEKLFEQAAKPSEMKTIPLRERKAYAEKLAKDGMKQTDLADHLMSRGVASVDARKLASDATFAATEPKGADKPKTEEPGIVMPSNTVPNSEAKPGDQLGLFGEATKAPKQTFKPSVFEKPKQANLFDTHGNSNQMDLFGDNATPDDLVYKPVSSQTTEPSPKAISLSDQPKLNSAFTKEMSDRIQDFGEKIGGARKDRAKPLGPRATKPKPEVDEYTPKGWRSRYEVSRIDKSSKPSEEGKWSVHDKRQKTWYGQPKEIGVFDTKEDAEKAIPLAEVARNHSVHKLSREGEPANYAIVRKVSERKHPTVKDGFSSYEDAMKFMATHPEKIIEHKTAITDAMIHPAIDSVTRKGEDYRKDKQSTSDSFKKFGFRGVEFGKWNNNAEIKEILNHADDAMMDLAKILDLKPSDISLGGELGLGFGSRGQGLSGAKAHYEPDYAAINLTKLNGAGSLAHEWAHALDHYLSRQSGKAESTRTKNSDGDLVFKDADASDFVSHGHRRSNNLSPGYDPELKQAFDNVMDAIHYKPTEYTEDATKHDKFHKKRVAEVNKELDGLRESFTKDYTNDSYKPYRGARNNAPLPKEQMKEVDSIIDSIKSKIDSGDFGEVGYMPSKASLGGPRIHKMLHRLNEIYKEHRGRNAYHSTRSGYSTRHSGKLIDISSAMSALSSSKQQLDSAKSGEVKTAKVRTDYHNMSKSMDRGTVKDYWSTPHELFARALDSYIYDKIKKQGNHNDLLAHGKHNDKAIYRMLGVKPFPEGEEKGKIDSAIDKLLEKIREHKHIDSPERIRYSAVSNFRPVLLHADDLRYDQDRSEQINHLYQMSCAEIFRYSWKEEQHPRDQIGRFTKVRELAEHPELQSHHSLHVDNQDIATQIRLRDYGKRFRALWAQGIRMAGANDEESIWHHVDKNALQTLISQVNADNHKSKLDPSKPRLDDLFNANQVIPKSIAERLHGGSRFFDPEKLRGRWNEKAPAPSTAQNTSTLPNEAHPPLEAKKEQSNDMPVGQESSSNESVYNDALEALKSLGHKPNEAKKLIEKAKSSNTGFADVASLLQSIYSKPKPSGPEAPSQIAPHDGLSTRKRNEVNNAIADLVSDDPNVIDEFRPILVEAWKQRVAEVNEHNQAMRQITGTTTPQAMSALIRGARNKTLDPASRRNFDIMLSSAESGPFGHLLQGRGEDGLLDFLNEGIKPQPDILDDDVAERAVSMAGPGFFQGFDHGDPPTDSDEHVPFSWVSARKLIDIYRYSHNGWEDQVRNNLGQFGRKDGLPTQAQAEAGNYKMKHVRFQGLDISIETQMGMRRKPEYPPMAADYGYIKGTTGRDGDHLDVFVGPNHDSPVVFAIDQVDEHGEFDEHKFMLGFKTESQAVETYKKCYTPSWKVGPVTTMTVGQFKQWLKHGSHRAPIERQVSRYSTFEPKLIG